MILRRVLLLVILAGCGSLPAGEPFSERLLATLPEQANVLVPPAFSADGSRAAYVLRKPEGDDVVFGPVTRARRGRVC